MTITRDQVLDVRDIITRVEELESELTDAKDGRSEQEAAQDLSEWCAAVQQEENFPLEEEVSEHLSLTEFLSDLAGQGGDEQWRGTWYPVTLIRDDYFEEYVQDLVSDIGDMPREIPSYIVIDWARTANNIQQDYTSAEFGGETYWFR